MDVSNGDCLTILKLMPDNSVDSIVTDPPYGINFMGKKWDYDVPSVEIWEECLRVLKPGGHLLAFAGTRTQHRMAVRIEDAGFEIRDMAAWVYGSGFPKSLDISKAIDKSAGAEREILSERAAYGIGGNGCLNGHSEGATAKVLGDPVTPEAAQWQGWGTALKPALEPITVARKPIVGTVANNVLAYSTGGINIDGCRVTTDENLNGGGYSKNYEGSSFLKYGGKKEYCQPTGRWPANLLHDGSDEVLEAFPDAKGQQGDLIGHDKNRQSPNEVFGVMGPAKDHKARSDSGSAARFFYCAKASKSDRNYGCDDLPTTSAADMTNRTEGSDGLNSPRAGAGRTSGAKNNHPTVKPIQLMRYLCRLVTPPGGIVLDPFTGSGSTGVAAILEGFDFIGMERDQHSADIANARVSYASKEMGRKEMITVIEYDEDSKPTGRLARLDMTREDLSDLLPLYGCVTPIDNGQIRGYHPSLWCFVYRSAMSTATGIDVGIEALITPD